MDLRIGLIGVGGRGYLADYIGTKARIVAGADLSPECLAKFREKFGANIFTTLDYRELLARQDIDAVVITTPDYCHEEMAIAALYTGKAVYLEKPMAISIEGCDRILETACRTGNKLFLGHNMRHYPVIGRMKEIIDAGLIGDIQAVWCRHFINYGGDAYFKNWHSERRYVNGLLLQKGVHDIDVIHYLCNSYTNAVSGMGRLSVYDACARRSPDEPGDNSWSDANWPPKSQTGLSPIIDIEDHNMIMLQLANGVQACYMQCHYTPDAERNYTFIGTRGRLENIGDEGECEIRVWTSRGSRAKPDMIYHLKGGCGSHGGSDGEIIGNFIDFVRFDAPIKTSPVAARNAVAVGVKGHESMRSDGRRLEIPPLKPEIAAYFERGQKRKEPARPLQGMAFETGPRRVAGRRMPEEVLQ
ncbi:Gfo/Idh/MocA family protein [Victivallis sp. Marseille-Q1083]|uniref:Gfo/Idh/MocA family protein n=1 Tax=Victivallis sp. Marseille-Q1083 TaxID=2717288 RepID=UPI001C377B53|nr:Gfo/Idh/MocA family oxidoreductase [Victivallis sp. Marseille-Q1083]